MDNFFRVSLPKEVHQKLRKIAEADRRTFANEIAFLIEERYNQLKAQTKRAGD